MTGSGDDPGQAAPIDQYVQIDVALVRLLHAVEIEVDTYLRHQTPEHLDALKQALSQLDAQTADSDAWIAGVTNTASWGVDPKGSVIGETGTVPVAEDVTGGEFNAQIELVKAAKQVVQNATPQTVGELRKARAELDAFSV